MSGAAELDKVTLNAIDYKIKGTVVIQPVAEFETGLKVGQATYDNREQAFYLVLDDFSAGFGHRRLNIRDALGTFYDAYPTNGADTARAGHITLPPFTHTQSTPTAPTANLMTKRGPSYPYCNASGVRQLVGIGSGIYSSNGANVWNREFAGGADAGQCTAIVPFITNAPGAPVKHFAAFNSQSGLLTGTARYQKSTDDGDTWANGAANYVFEDLMFWDNKLIAALGRQIVFGTIVAGTEVWNIDDPNDGEYIASVAEGHIHFVGVAQAPNGEPAVHFTDEHRLWWLDFYARKCYPIELGLGGHMAVSTIWSGGIYISDGWNVFEYNPSGQSVRNIGFPRKDGVPPSLRDELGGFYYIRHLIPSDDYMYAVASSSALNKTILFRYNGSGWNQLGAPFSSFYSNVGFQANFPLVGDVTSRLITMAGAASTTSTTVKINALQIPALSNTPTTGTVGDVFGASDAGFITGWIDGGFAEIDGVLLRMSVDGWSLNSQSYVKVEYQLDNDEDASWVQLKDSAGVADVFNLVNKVLYFGSTAGVEFRTVRFRIRLIETHVGGHYSPELRALTLVYNKKPELRNSYKFTIDVDRMVNRGEYATFKAVYDTLETAWNTKTLISLTIPNIAEAKLVMVADMITEVDNIRDEKKGDGSITVTCLEPVTT